MRVPFMVLDAIDSARILGRHQWALRLLTLFGAALVVTCAEAASGEVGIFLAVVVLSAAGWAATRPDSARPAFLIGVLLVMWFARVDDPATPWSLGGALGLLLVHASMAYAADTPPGGVASRRTHGRWAGQTLAVATVTSALWALLLMFARVDAPGQTLVTGAAFVGVLTTALVLVARSIGDRPLDPRA